MPQRSARAPSEIDISKFYARDVTARSLFLPEEEEPAFRLLEEHCSAAMSELLSLPNARSLLVDDVMSLREDPGSLAEIEEHSTGGRVPTQEAADNRARMLAEEVALIDDRLALAQSEDDRKRALKDRWFALFDSTLGRSLLHAALSLEEAAQARRHRSLMEAQRNRIVEANLRLVQHVVKRYVREGLSFSDLVQEGSCGLMRAAAKFDFRLGYKFSTYAIWWIKQSVIRFMREKSSDVRVPCHVGDTVAKCARESSTFYSQHGRSPEEDEIEALSLVSREMRIAVHRARQPIMRLDAPIRKDGDGDATLLDVLADADENNDSERRVTAAQAKSLVESALLDLTPRERQILSLRYGLMGASPGMTLAEVGEIIGVSRERIRQVESSLLKRLAKRHDGFRALLV